METCNLNREEYITTNNKDVEKSVNLNICDPSSVKATTIRWKTITK
jgi:hypothetical protein